MHWDSEAEDKDLLRDMDVDAYLLQCVNIDPTNLDDEFMRLPGDLAYWNERFAVATRQYLYAKKEYEEERATQYLLIKESATTKLTVSDLDALVTTHPRVVAVRGQLVEAEADKNAIRCRVDAICAKRDMLQSYGAKIRAELMSDPALRDALLSQKTR